MAKIGRLVTASRFGLVPVGLRRPAAAQFPGTAPITIVMPYPPGGLGDYFVRLVAPKLAESLGTTVLVDNRPGANGAHRHGGGGARQAGRPYHRLRPGQHGDHQPVADEGSRLRSAQGSDAAGPGAGRAQRPGRQPVRPGRDPAGTARAGAPQARLAELCLGGNGIEHPPAGGDAEARARHRHRARRLQGRRARPCRICSPARCR